MARYGYSDVSIIEINQIASFAIASRGMIDDGKNFLTVTNSIEKENILWHVNRL